LEPARIACGNTEGKCPTASATIFFCGATCGSSYVTCMTPSGLGETIAVSGNLELLRRELASRLSTH
jgi:hypothetical protein